MRYRNWFVVMVGLAGLCAPAAGQSADPRSDRPDPADYLLPPVNNSSRSRASSDDLPQRPRRASSDDRYAEDELPPPRPRSSGNSNRLRPIPPLPRDDEDSPPSIRPRRPAPPRYEEDEEPPAPRPRRSAPAPRYADDDSYDPPPRPRRLSAPPSDERGDELPPPKPPRRQPAPAPRDDEYDPPPPPRRKPAASLGAPGGNIRPVSAVEVEDSRSYGDEGRADRERPPVNIIDYLAGDRDGNATPPSGGYRKQRFEPADRKHEAALFGKKVSDVFEPLAPAGHDWFKSDHCFDSFVSPVTNPFLFEDPRSLTEVRPLFIYQRVPSSEPLFNGGNLYFIGLQGRLAITDKLSLVIHKFGGQGVDPSTAFDLANFNSDNFGLSEFWLGPKYTFIRNVDDGRLMAGGLQFQIPLGSGKVYQNTGSLSIVPYLSFAQNFFSTNYGSFNGLIGTGYAFSTNSERSDYYYLSSHIDFDVMNMHRFYPLAELNYYYYSTNGSSKPFEFEGRDLINFGGQAKGSNLLTWALGGRVKVTQSTEIGGAFEGPLVGNRELFRYRFTLDFIWRY